MIETLSAFPNTNGGLLLLGLDEQSGFTPVALNDPAKLRTDLASAASSCLVSPLRIATGVIEAEGTMGLAVRTGGRRYAAYSLVSADLVAEALRELTVASSKQLIDATGYSRPTVLARLEELIKEGLVKAEGSPRSPTRRYLWTGV